MRNHKKKRLINLNLIEKTFLASLGALISKETINKATTTIYNDIQNEIKGLIGTLEKRGKLKTKETQKLIKTVQEKADDEKAKIYKQLKKQSKGIFKTTKSFANSLLNSLKQSKPSQNSKSKVTKKKRKTKH